MKVSSTFSKVVESRGKASGRAPQSAELSCSLISAGGGVRGNPRRGVPLNFSSHCTCAPFYWSEAAASYCPFHPISLLLRKETGWSHKETRSWRWAEADSDSDARDVDRPRKAAITSHVRPRRRQPSDNHQPPPQVGRGTFPLQSSSAHANGGATRVKKRFSLAARHRFFGQAPKKWDRMAGQSNDHRPA